MHTFLSMERNDEEEQNYLVVRIAAIPFLAPSKSHHESQRCEAASDSLKQDVKVKENLSDKVRQSEFKIDCNPDVMYPETVQPTFNSNEKPRCEEMKQASPTVYKYDLQEILPILNEACNSDDEMINKRKGKSMNRRLSDENNIIMEGILSKYMNKHHTLVKRYVVLNSLALFVYKDDVAFRSFPMKPVIVVPLCEIASVTDREFKAAHMLKSGSMAGHAGKETVHLLEISLQESYNRVQQQINNFSCQNFDFKAGAKKTNQPQQKVKDVDEMGFVFADSSKKVVQKWIKRIMTAMKRIQRKASRVGEEQAALSSSGANEVRGDEKQSEQAV